MKKINAKDNSNIYHVVIFIFLAVLVGLVGTFPLVKEYQLTILLFTISILIPYFSYNYLRQKNQKLDR